MQGGDQRRLEQAELIGIQRSKTIQEYLFFYVIFEPGGAVSTYSDFTIVVHIEDDAGSSF
jgi:hypothetical protein